MADKPVILLTGFSSFPGAPLNPTKITLQHMRQSDKSLPQSVIFPVSYRIVDKYLDQVLNITRPDIILSFGLSYEADGFTFETTAYNETDRECGDINHIIPESSISGHSPPSLNTRIPFKKLYNLLQKSNIPSSVSTDPGRYLCNYLYFRIMEKYKDDQSKWCCFIHVPLLSTQLNEIRELYPEKNINKSLSSETLQEGINLIVNFLNHEWGRIYG